MTIHQMNTGDTGRLRIIDKTIEDLPTVEMWIQSLSPVSVPLLPWSYSIENDRVSWRNFDFKNTTVWQRLGAVTVRNGLNFTLHLGETNTSQLGGPTDFTVPLEGTDPAFKYALVRVPATIGWRWAKAIPYVKHEGVWRVAEPFARTERGWKGTG